MALRVLLLGGTSEASALAALLAGDAQFEPCLSLAGRTQAPRLPPIAHRIGGFGGAAGLADYLRASATAAVVDATHPFAVRIGANAVRAAAETGVSLLAVVRPAWRPSAGDDWTLLPDVAACARALGPVPRRVLLTVGRQELAPFRAAPRHWYVLRSVEAPEPGLLPPNCRVITARGPFAEPDERRLLQAEGIEIIVTKNSGGTATRAKLDAARSLGVKVLMVQRPPRVAAPETADGLDAAWAWLADQAARHGT